MNNDGSLPQDKFDEVIHTLPRFLQVQYPDETIEAKEREIIHTNRVKLTDYIHDATVLFPYLKQHGIFSVFDCDVIKGEPVAHNRVDKFIDVLLTKGPHAIGAFHESLGKTYPGVFDYLTRLFASAGIDLPETRRMRPASIVDQMSESTTYDMRENAKDSITSQPGDEHEGRHWGHNVSRRGMTVRRSLDVLSRQLDAIQTERNELKNALSYKEKEIAELIRSKEKNRDDLFSITQHYQEIYSNLMNWKEALNSDSSQRLQELLAERECIQAEYDALENDYALVQLELRAARERISRLMSQLERSERLVAFANEERDALQSKYGQLEGDLQRLQRKMDRDVGAANKGATAGRRDAEMDQIVKQLEKAQKDLEASRVENVELSERLTVARSERNEALEEKDSILQKQYHEEQKRKKAESELRTVYKKLQQIKESSESHSSDGSLSVHTGYPPEGSIDVKMEDFTTVIQASADMGMKLGLGILVVNVEEEGLASRCGIKTGDQLCQVNHITVTNDREPLDLCNRLLHNASTLVTLLIRRPVVCFDSAPSSANGLPMSQIHQTPCTGDTPRKPSTFARTFALPISTSQTSSWDTSVSFPSTTSDRSVLFTPTSRANTMGPFSNFPLSSSSPTMHSCPGGRGESYVLPTTYNSLSLKNRRKMTKSKRKNSDDAHSTQVRNEERQEEIIEGIKCETSSSDDNFPHDVTIPGFTDSMDQGNYGIVHSPDLTDKEGLFRFHDDDLPPMITRPPTLIKNESDDFHEVKGVDTDVSFNVKDLYRTQSHQLAVSPSNKSHPPYQPMLSSPGRVFIEKAGDSPSLRRSDAKKWMYKNRKSLSLVDINDFDDSTSSNTELDTRRIILPWGRLGSGIMLVGGRGRGIFIYSEKEDSRGLQTGDKLLKIGGESADCMTYREVVEMIDYYGSKGDQCMITVYSNKEEFEKLPSLKARDCFYVKTLYSVKKTSLPIELTFEEGEVLKVIDTMPPVNNMWKVIRINLYGEERDEGYVSIEQNMINWKATPGNSSSFPAVSRFSANRRLNSQPGPELFRSLHTTTSNSGSPYDIYQPVTKYTISSPRPVIIMGVCENEVRQALQDDPAYSLPPINTHITLSKLQDECSGQHILLKRTGENVRYCLLKDVKAIAEQDQHCILSIEPSQLKSNTVLSSIHPIILLLYTKKSSLGFKFQVYRCSSDAIAKYLQDLKIIEENFSSFFTGRVDVSGGLDNVVKKVKTEVANQQRMVLWLNDHK